MITHSGGHHPIYSRELSLKNACSWFHYFMFEQGVDSLVSVKPISMTLRDMWTSSGSSELLTSRISCFLKRFFHIITKKQEFQDTIISCLVIEKSFPYLFSSSKFQMTGSRDDKCLEHTSDFNGLEWDVPIWRHCHRRREADKG